MPEQPNQERTEPATQRRKDDAREKGQVARSIEVNSALIMIACLVFFILAGGQLVASLKSILIEYFQKAAHPHLEPENTRIFLTEMIFKSLRMIAPFLGLMMLIGIIGNLIQFGFLFTANPLIPDFKKINPVSGFGRLISRRAWIDLVKSLLKVILISWIAYLSITSSVDAIFDMTGLDVPAMSFLFNRILLSVMVKIVLGLVLIAILDYSYQRWEYGQNLKMTRQEIREEYKQYEGDPMIKSRIRSIQREMSRRRM
ncbi:MAG: EscU/YscU/HrcU family type III secretion system export apparatus switch protein, partial [Candidatus Delongbacteria bacterium]|nr:EscU/YscU/HrcU family type III secretion system export apparatus switch protein [Candidatus Delongbacteria bacterium]